MTFDDELKHAFEALTARLQTELERQVQAVKDELATAAPPPPPPPPPKEELAPATHDAEADDRLVEGIRSIDNARSLSEILDALAIAAARDAARVAVLLARGGEWRAWRTSGFDHEPDVAALVAMPSDDSDSRGRVRLPIAVSGETVGALYAEDGRLAALEILARHAARCLESMTAFKTARALARQDQHQGDETGNDDDDMSARRYARLLVSEIKLYHEAEVVAGRRERDLMSRLGGEITRARALYDQRVPVHVRQRADYFHDELVRTLADGDARLVEPGKYEVGSTK